MSRRTTLGVAVLLVASLALATAACSSDDAADAADAATTTDSATPTTLSADEATSVGEELVRSYYDDLTTHDVDALGASLDDSFQSVTATGSKTKQEVLDVVTSATYGTYELTDFKVTTTSDVIIVTYKAELEVNGQMTPITARVNTFAKIGDDWKGIVYADAGVPAS